MPLGRAYVFAALLLYLAPGDIGLPCILQTKDDAFCIGRRTRGDTGDLER
jgi:hypothetical protein